MSFKTFLKRSLLEYFIITTCVTAAIGVLGLFLEPDASFGYEAYFSPLIFGLISLIPSLVTYSPKELSLHQALIRKMLHILVLEAMLIGFGVWAGIIHGLADGFSFGLTVFIVYLIVNFVNWQLDKKTAEEINKMLKSLRSTEGIEDTD